MKKIFIFIVMMLVASVSAAIYQEPWIQNQLGDQHNLTDMNYISAEVINGTYVNGTYIGEVNWTKLTNYPSACPGSSAITGLNDSVTCSDLWVDVAGDTMTGNLNTGTNNITNATEISSTLIDTTNLEVDNLEGNMDGTGFNITASWFFGSINWSDIANKFITAVDDSYIYMSGTTATLNETKLNATGDARYVNIDGDVMTGNLNMSGNNITEINYLNSGGTDLFLGGNTTVGTGTTWLEIYLLNSVGYLDSNYPINITNDLKVTGDLDVTGNITGNQIYSEMFYHNHTATQMNFAVDGIYYSLFFTNASHLNGFSYVGGFNTSSNLTAEIAGLYSVNWMASGDGQNNHVYYTSIYINDTNQDNCETYKKMTAGGDIITMTGTCFIDISVGDNIGLRTADVGGTGTGNYYSSNLNLVRIGD